MTVLDERGQPMLWPKTQWSYSALGKFERCEMEYAETNLRKHFTEASSAALEQGNEVHKILEQYVSSRTKASDLPVTLRHVAAAIDKLCENAIAIFAERDINLTYDLRICGPFDRDVCYRGRLDLTLVMPNEELIVVDYKTSREPTESFDQLEMAATAALIEYPHIKTAYGCYLYTKHRVRQMEPIHRHDIPNQIRKMQPRLQRLFDARLSDTFRAIPNFRCKKYCPVVTCIHNARTSVTAPVTQRSK